MVLVENPTSPVPCSYSSTSPSITCAKRVALLWVSLYQSWDHQPCMLRYPSRALISYDTSVVPPYSKGFLREPEECVASPPKHLHGRVGSRCGYLSHPLASWRAKILSVLLHDWSTDQSLSGCMTSTGPRKSNKFWTNDCWVS